MCTRPFPPLGGGVWGRARDYYYTLTMYEMLKFLCLTQIIEMSWNENNQQVYSIEKS